MFGFLEEEDLLLKIDEYNPDIVKNKHVFRLKWSVILKSSIFFIVMVFVAIFTLYSLYEKKETSLLKVVFSIALLCYSIYNILKLVLFKMVIENNDTIKYSKLVIPFDMIKTATVKLTSFKGKKIDRYLEIITKDNKKVLCQLNIKNDLFFLKLFRIKLKDNFKVEL